MTRQRETHRAATQGLGGGLRRLLYRSSLAAFIAAIVDFGVFNGLMLWEGTRPNIATALGCIVGAVVNYTINRVWTFQSKDAPSPQLVRYALVSATGAGLSSAGMTLLVDILRWGTTLWGWRACWVVVRLAVSWGWNLPLQRFFVFPKSHAS